MLVYSRNLNDTHLSIYVLSREQVFSALVACDNERNSTVWCATVKGDLLESSTNVLSILDSVVDEKIGSVDLIGGGCTIFALNPVICGMATSADALISPALAVALTPVVTILIKLSY